MWFFFFDSVPDTQTGADSLVSVVVESWSGSDRSLFLLQTLWPHKCGFNMLMCCVCEWFHSCNTSKGEVTHWRWPWLTAFVMQWRLCCCDSTWTPDGSRTTHFHWRSMRSTHYSSNGSPVNHTHFPFFSSICQAIYYLQIPVKSAAIFADHLPALSCSWWRSKLAEKKNNFTARLRLREVALGKITAVILLQHLWYKAAVKCSDSWFIQSLHFSPWHCASLCCENIVPDCLSCRFSWTLYWEQEDNAFWPGDVCRILKLTIGLPSYTHRITMHTGFIAVVLHNQRNLPERRQITTGFSLLVTLKGKYVSKYPSP